MNGHAPRMDIETLLAELENGPALSPQVARWLHDGAVRFATGEARTLCAALGLRRRGQSSAATRQALKRRNAALQRAFRHIVGESTRQRMLTLQRLVRPPLALHIAGPLREALADAYRSGAYVPTSLSRLYEIVEPEGSRGSG
ncbi:hypothetical protein EV699_103128 [Plasticicumulans lactativorans]|uniref:Uncharacterized protein n=2 Tax=Plasticicumulans lactativorans TaxID=1133106 RepID=A0A4R2LA55_9GAMM|nr:hypothetical protein EV699_103128 [Plasticicumulans lactativorans]